MPDERNDEISKLLRLKRFEQPPPQYFENFLHEFHRRQRAELLRQPLWRIAWERIAAFFSEETTSRFAYGEATALVLLTAAITAFNIVNTPRNDATFAQAGRVSGAPTLSSPEAKKPESIALNGKLRLPDIAQLPQSKVQTATASLRPRYVMDARPVSYEPASSF